MYSYSIRSQLPVFCHSPHLAIVTGKGVSECVSECQFTLAMEISPHHST